MAFRFIKVNKAKCLTCGEILHSKPEEAGKEITCNCGGLTIAGGATHAYRKGTNYKDMCILDFSDCPEVATEIPMPPPGSDISEDELKTKSVIKQ